SENVTLLDKERRWSEIRFVLIGPVRPHAVRGPGQENRIVLFLVLGRVNGRKEFFSVPHRDAVFVLCVLSLDLLQSLRRDIAGCNKACKGSENNASPCECLVQR